MREVQLPEARCFYGFQIMIENIHSGRCTFAADRHPYQGYRREELPLQRGGDRTGCDQEGRLGSPFHPERQLAERPSSHSRRWKASSSPFVLLHLLAEEARPHAGPQHSSTNSSRATRVCIGDFARLLYSMLENNYRKPASSRSSPKRWPTNTSSVTSALPVSLIGMNSN